MGALVPEAYKKEIQQQNRILDLELEEYKINTISDMVINNYQDRFTYINQFNRNQQSKKRPLLCNFASFSRQSPENPPNEQFKLHLLDMALQQASGKQIKLEDLAKNKLLTNKLEVQFSAMPPQKAPSSIASNQFNMQNLLGLMQTYQNKILLANAVIVAIDKIIKEEYTISFSLFNVVLEKSNMQQNDFLYRLSKDTTKILLLKLSCLLFNKINLQTPKQILAEMDVIAYYTKQIPKNDIVLLQTQKIL